MHLVAPWIIKIITHYHIIQYVKKTQVAFIDWFIKIEDLFDFIELSTTFLTASGSTRKFL